MNPFDEFRSLINKIFLLIILVAIFLFVCSCEGAKMNPIWVLTEEQASILKKEGLDKLPIEEPVVLEANASVMYEIVKKNHTSKNPLHSTKSVFQAKMIYKALKPNNPNIIIRKVPHLDLWDWEKGVFKQPKRSQDKIKHDTNRRRK